MSIHGDLIRETRLAKDIYQLRVSVLAEISPQFLCDVEQGRRNASIPVLERIAEVLEVPAITLVQSRLQDEAGDRYEVFVTTADAKESRLAMRSGDV